MLRIMTFTNLGMAFVLGLFFTMSVGMKFRQVMYKHYVDILREATWCADGG